MSHRVKNSLTSVVGLLRVQARSAQSQDVKNALEDPSLRVSTIAEVHDHLWRSSHVGFVELADFMTELCKKLRGNTGSHTLHCYSDPMLLAADHAIPLGPLINELLTNAVKYAYPESSGEIEVSAREIGGNIHVEVSDHGTDLPEGFDIDQPRAGLGFKVVTGMVRQLHGQWTFLSCGPGSDPGPAV
jgi:two-component sensor histidine kinase